MTIQQPVVENSVNLSCLAESAKRSSDAAFRRLLDKLPAGAYTCDAQGLITYYNSHAEQLWGRRPSLNDPVDRFCGSFQLFSPEGVPLAHDQCWMALALKEGQEYNGQEIIVQRPTGQQLTVLAHANPIRDVSGRLVGAVNVLVDITAQKKAEEAVQRLNESLEEQVTQRTAALGILHDVAIAANEARSINEALIAALRRICDDRNWVIGHAWRTAEDNPQELVSSGVWYSQPGESFRWIERFQQSTEQTRISVGSGFIGHVAHTGEPVWLADVDRFPDWRREDPQRFGLRSAVAFPVLAGGAAVAVLEFFSDQRIDRDPRFMEIMTDVGIQLGHVFERKNLEKTIADATAEQQRRISGELHDTVSQLLTGAAMMGESLRQVLHGESSPHAKLAEKLGRSLREAQQQVRQVSRGLMPLETDAISLMKALERLAGQCPQLYSIPCRLECHESVYVEDNTVATQLYYIAREALHNAVKHAGAHSIVVQLENAGRSVRLVVEDDGHGIGGDGSREAGMGLAMMRYRAGVIDGKLDVFSDSGAGTKVTCTAPIDRMRPPRRRSKK